MKPWKQAIFNTIGYLIAWILVKILGKGNMEWSAALLLSVVYFVLNYLMLSAIHCANKK